MNVYDSEQIAIGLSSLGYQQTSFLEKADLVIVNTCSVRAKAEQKAFSFMGRLAAMKRSKPGMIIGAGGCVAQQEGKRILKRMPHLDIVFGTRAIHRLPGLIKKIESKRCRIVDVDMDNGGELADHMSEPQAGDGICRFVTIMRGCDNFCAYCVVPYVRGREVSRDPDKIIIEIEGLVNSGIKEVTLLGQNVNSYGKKEALCSFPELLARANEISALERIRFTTSHPKDLGDSLINAFKTLEKLCHHIHLPVQSGSDPILKRMNRKYTRDVYLDKISKLRDTCPDIAISSDFIVGFPGETTADFDQTLDLLQTVEFDGLFAFMYSDRPDVPASRFSEKISESEKKDRLQNLLSLQETITRRKNQALVGSDQLILAEGFSKKQTTGGSESEPAVQWTGRTSTNKIVNFYQPHASHGCGEIYPGRLVNVNIERALSHSLWGTPISSASATGELKGENSHAA